MDPREATSIRVGEFQLDSPAQRLWRNGEAIDLVPQVGALLRVLVERSGKVVTKEEIMATAWPGTVVSDAALSQAIRRLRTAFGDDARKPRYIETVHRRGFRFIAPIQIAATTPPRLRESLEETGLFVGRETELVELATLLQTARGGIRQVVFIEGESGIGKTALVESFRNRHAGEGLRLAAAQCVEQHGSAEPYLPILEALDRLARSDPGLLDILRRYAPTWLAQMPWLLGQEEARGLEGSITDATGARMMREMASALEVISLDRPLVVILEDLHWADEATLDLLGSIAQRPDAARLMVLGTYRPAEAIAYDHPVVSLSRSLWTKNFCTRLCLESLDAGEVEAYLSRRFSSPLLAAELAEQIQLRSEGNPLFLVAMVDHLVERGFLGQENGDWQLTRPVGEGDLQDIPNTLREMIEIQLTSLDPVESTLLQAASVAAVEFRSASVAAALERSDPNGVEEVENICERLVARRHLLRAAGDETWPDGTHTPTYAFRHQLYRQALYERLPAARRRRLHQRIGERMERGFAADPQRVAGELAGHFDESGDDAKAITYFALAARQAHHRFADREAAHLLGAALPHIEGLPAGSGRDLLELQMRTGILLADWLAELETPQESEHLARIQALVPVLHTEPDTHQLCSRVWNLYSFRSLADLSEPIAARMLATAPADRPAQQMEAHICTGMTSLRQGRFAAGTAQLTTALDLYGDGEPPACASFPGYETTWEDTGARLHGCLSLGLVLTGALDRASLHLRKALQLSAGRVHPKRAAAAYLSLAGILCLLCDLELAQTSSHRGLELAKAHTLTNLVAAGSPQNAWLRIKSGTGEDRTALIRTARQDYLRSRSSTATPVSPILLADACLMAALADEGLAIVETVWRDTRESGLRWYDAELQRLKGELILSRGKTTGSDEAAECFRRAIAIARNQGASLYELRAAMSLVRLSDGRRDKGDALAALERAYATFTEGLHTPDLRAAAEHLRGH